MTNCFLPAARRIAKEFFQKHEEIHEGFRAMTVLLLDTGVLFAYLSADDQDRAWATEQLDATMGPILTCEPVLVEAAYLIAHRGGNLERLWSFLHRRVIEVP